MTFIKVERDGEAIASIPCGDGGMEEQLSIYNEFKRQYPDSKISVTITEEEPFLGW